MNKHENLIKGLHELYLDLSKQNKTCAVANMDYGDKEIKFKITIKTIYKKGKKNEKKK